MKWTPAAVCSVLVFTLACSPPAPPAPTEIAVSTPSPVVVSAVEPARAPQPVAPIPTLRPSTLASPVPLPLSVLAGHSGADVRVTLDLLLQEQVYLSGAAIDASSNARLDELIGASNALDQNALACAQLFGAVKGQAAAQTLADAWRAQNADLLHLSDLLASADLDRRQGTIATALATGDLSSSAIEDQLRQRIQALRDLAASIGKHDSAAAAAQTRALVIASDALARPLAAAIAAELPAQAPPPTEGLDVDARLVLARSLLARVYLNGSAMAAAAAGRRAESSAIEVDDDAFAQQVASVWGAQFANVVIADLATQNAALVSVAGGGDRRAAASAVEQARTDLDTTLSSANPLLPPTLLAQQLRASDQPLLTAADAFAARDYVTAYTRLRESARQTQKGASTLALAMVDRYPARYLALPTPVPTAAPQ